MKFTTILLSLMLTTAYAFADHHEEKAAGHDEEHQHVSADKKKHEHDEAHHKDHDHKAHHQGHDKMKKEEKAKKK